MIKKFFKSILKRIEDCFIASCDNCAYQEKCNKGGNCWEGIEEYSYLNVKKARKCNITITANKRQQKLLTLGLDQGYIDIAIYEDGIQDTKKADIIIDTFLDKLISLNLVD